MKDKKSITPQVPLEHLIFVNRNLRLSSIKMVGFDMDYTLAIYKYPKFEELALEKTINRLIEKGYPEEIFDKKFDSRYVMRGLVVDKINGNILKLDKYNFVHRAMHGKTNLTYEERYANYRNKKLDLFSNDFLWLDTLFSLPEVAIIINTIERLKTLKHFQHIKLYDLISDIRKSIDEIHQDGTLKKIVQKDISEYIEFDPLLPSTLHRLKSNGKKLFLLTNSLWEYTNHIMSYLLNNRLKGYQHWTTYFDIIIVGAGKPEFFSENKPFELLNTTSNQSKPLSPSINSFIKGEIFQGGNILDFERLSAIKGEQILYVGDHIYGDILSSKKKTLWRTCMIIPELADEIKITINNIKEIKKYGRMELKRIILERELNQIKYNIKNGINNYSKGEIEKKKEKYVRLIQNLENMKNGISSRFNPFWGSLLREENELSKFGAQIEDYACIYTSRVSNFINISPDQYLVSPPKLLPHELELEEMVR